MDTVMVVYAINPKTNSVWIYGAFKDNQEGFYKMKEMQESNDYGHLIWTNNIVSTK